MIRIDDDDDISNMMEGSSLISMYVSNKPIEFDCTEYRPPTMPDNGPSDCIEYRPPTILDNGIEDEHDSEIERHIDDIDPIENPMRINRYKVVLRDDQDFDDVQAGRNHLIDYAISQNFNMKFIKNEVSELPCNHAIAAIDHKHEDVIEFYGIYFTVQMYRRAYSLPFNPMPDVLELSNIVYIAVLPSATRRTAGRPKKQHRQIEYKEITPLKCNRCGVVGRNRKTSKSST
ncbi:hypothetical protein AMTR_s00164p00051510 [Amborella trichopoda]|uniref:Transposase MuDR plant domain-containing protein n=1 Tax=Amborella trichopoda TaxID=13333 RepID=W1PLM2_AMBTC|nr:hypothetical protein AMTR_s00164p00051510 [Amborella trichopoda]